MSSVNVAGLLQKLFRLFQAYSFVKVSISFLNEKTGMEQQILKDAWLSTS